MSQRALPAWIDIAVLPLVNVMLALFAAGLFVFAIGENPVEAVQIMLRGAFGYDEGLGYTLYYATNFIFTGLAVAIAFHAGLFNIGGEGQAYIGGLGVGLVCLALDRWLPWWALLPLAIVAGALFGGVWAAIPGYLQAYRGSHIVITTIMFNFLASALMVYLLVNVLIVPGNMSPETRDLAEAAQLPLMNEIFAWFGISITRTPLNFAFILALLVSFLIWLLIWRTRWGYAIRMIGLNERAAVYSGINTRQMIVLTMAISGALASLVGINEVMGAQQRIVLDFVAGSGFTGIAVALMGRNHPVGIILASLLFGALFQGGAELAFEVPTITRDLVVVIQGLVILFCGALAFMMRGPLERLYFAFVAKGEG